MCNYCGCREFPEVARLTEEHLDIAEVAGALERAISTGREDQAVRLLGDLIDLLIPHTYAEERGLFAELRDEGSMADTVDALCAEHEDIHGVLQGIDPVDPDWAGVSAALQRLHRHIDKEEHGVFPAAVIVLPDSAWDRVTANV